MNTGWIHETGRIKMYGRSDDQTAQHQNSHFEKNTFKILKSHNGPQRVLWQWLGAHHFPQGIGRHAAYHWKAFIIRYPMVIIPFFRPLGHSNVCHSTGRTILFGQSQMLLPKILKTYRSLKLKRRKTILYHDDCMTVLLDYLVHSW